MSLKKKVYGYIQLIRRKKYVPIIQTVPNDQLLKDKTAIITGGTGSIGKAVAKAFSKSGCTVVIVGSNDESVSSALSEMKLCGIETVSGANIDLRKTAEIPQCIDKLLKELGIQYFDILVNAAGIAAHHSFEAINEEEYDSIMSTNLKAAFFMSQYICKLMIENRCKGHILNISSSSALRPAWTPYQISKWGMRGFTLGLADIMIKHGIVVNAIAPGPTATKMMGINSVDDGIEMEGSPSGRMLISEEIGELAVDMVSRKGDMIIGDTVYITGGSGVITLHN